MEERKKERKKDTDYKTGGNGFGLPGRCTITGDERENFEEWEERESEDGRMVFTVGWRGCGNFYPFGG